MTSHDDVIKWKCFPRYWPFVWGIHRSPVNSPHKGQWRGALMFSLICVWINGWVNNREAGDLRCYHTHYDVIVMWRIQIGLWYHKTLLSWVDFCTHTTSHLCLLWISLVLKMPCHLLGPKPLPEPMWLIAKWTWGANINEKWIKMSNFSFKKMHSKMFFAKYQSFHYCLNVLTHWSRVTHICISDLPIIGSDDGLSPSQRQAIIWTNDWILLMRPLGTNLGEILIKIHIFSFMKMHLKMSSGK